MTNALTLENCKAYATESNLDAALARLGFDNYGGEGEVPCRFIKCRNSEGRHTAIFLLTEYFNRNSTGGYAGVFANKGFMSI